MNDAHHKIAFVVATKDRPNDLEKMLRSLKYGTRRPDQVVIVDSSIRRVRKVTENFPELNIKYIYHNRPSSSEQRNIGIGSIAPDIDLICFADDDITFKTDALENILEYWKVASEDLAGIAFNILNPKPNSMRALKQTRFAQSLDLYSQHMGKVMRSGWQTIIHTVHENLETDWLPSCAAVWRRNLLKREFFDSFFDGYSYLEDLDSSFVMRKKGYQLIVLANAGYYHWHSTGGRSSSLRFGRIETRNRLYFVCKHKLSLPRCIIAMLIRWGMSIASFQWGRAVGNLIGIFDFIKIKPAHYKQ